VPLLSPQMLQALGVPASPPLTAATESFLLRGLAVLYDLAQRAPQDALAEATAAGSTLAYLRAITELAITAAPPVDEWTVALLRGHLALAAALEAAGGVWTDDEVVERCAVGTETLLRWREQHRVLALARPDGTFVYPVAQFSLRETDADVMEPYAAMRGVLQRVGDAMSQAALAGLLATPQPMLAQADGRAVSPFAALAAGRAQETMALLDWVLTPSDAGAPAVG